MIEALDFLNMLRIVVYYNGGGKLKLITSQKERWEVVVHKVRYIHWIILD